MLVIAAFADGAFGAALGALPAFTFTGFMVVAGESVNTLASDLGGVEVDTGTRHSPPSARCLGRTSGPDRRVGPLLPANARPAGDRSDGTAGGGLRSVPHPRRELPSVGDGRAADDGHPGSGKSAVVTALFIHLKRLPTGTGSVIHMSTRATSPTSPGFAYVDLTTTSEFPFYRRVLAALAEEPVPEHGTSTEAIRDRLHARLG